MSILEVGPAIIFCLLAAGILIGLIPESHHDAVDKFRKKCRDDGMIFQEIEAAISIRVSFVTLRRKASDHCVSRGGKIDRQKINEIAGQIAIGLAAVHGQEAAKSFIGWIDSCPDEEILYDDARAAAHAHTMTNLRAKGLYPPPRKSEVHEDIKGAFKVVKR